MVVCSALRRFRTLGTGKSCEAQHKEFCLSLSSSLLFKNIKYTRRAYLIQQGLVFVLFLVSVEMCGSLRPSFRYSVGHAPHWAERKIPESLTTVVYDVAYARGICAWHVHVAYARGACTWHIHSGEKAAEQRKLLTEFRSLWELCSLCEGGHWRLFPSNVWAAVTFARATGNYAMVSLIVFL